MDESVIINLFIRNSKKIIDNKNHYKIIWYLNNSLIKCELNFDYTKINKNEVYNNVKNHYSKIEKFKHVSMTFKKYNSLNKNIKKELTQYIKFIEYDYDTIYDNPYIKGGMFSSCLISEYYIPTNVDKYVKNLEKIRLQFLAGIIDNSGSIINNKQVINVINKKYVNILISLLNNLCICYSYKGNIIIIEDNIPYCKINKINTKKIFMHRNILTYSNNLYYTN